MTTIPVNAAIVPDGHCVVAIPRDQVDGQWRFCAAYRLTEQADGGVALEFATEDDLESITSPDGDD